MPNLKPDEDADSRLIALAAQLADRGAPNAEEFARRFRRYYRHLAVSSGQRFEYINLAAADTATDQALTSKS